MFADNNNILDDVVDTPLRILVGPRATLVVAVQSVEPVVHVEFGIVLLD